MRFGDEKLKNRVCLIIPYFGELPQYSKLFFKSVSANLNLDILLITDSDIKIPLKNVKVIRYTFEQLTKKIQEKFSFQIALTKPYKLCDFRPAYGYIFHEFLNDYEFWGYCDLDIIFGDFNQFVTDDILDNYDKVYQHGHLSLYRNCKRVNFEFMSDYGMSYREVFSTHVNCVFDELEGIQKKFDHDGFKTYKGWDFFDANPWKYHLTRVTSYVPKGILDKDFDFIHEAFAWDQGHLFRLAVRSEKIVKNEYLYIHFQKRNYQIFENIDKYNDVLYLTNSKCIKGIESINKNNIDKFNAFSNIKQFELIIKKINFVWKRRFKKYILRKG